MQKLLLPIPSTILTASYKTDAYLNKYKFPHYGADMVSGLGKREIYASGNGNVIMAGYDTIMGNTIIVQYNGAYNHVQKRSANVVIRYCHLESISAKAGDVVDTQSILGVYGNTGYREMANHLHTEIDTDTVYPNYTPSVVGRNFLVGSAYGAHDRSMFSPVEFYHSGSGQSYVTTKDSFILPSDYSIPAAEAAAMYYVRTGPFGSRKLAATAAADLTEKGFATYIPAPVAEGYYVQVGAFSNRAYAGNLAEKLKDAGYQAIIGT